MGPSPGLTGGSRRDGDFFFVTLRPRLRLRRGRIRMSLTLGVWSRSLMVRIESESLRLFCPHFADELVGRETCECLQASPVVVGVDEHREVGLELLVAVVVVSFDGGFLDGPVHPFDLSVGPSA